MTTTLARRPVGYSYLIEKFSLNVLPLHRTAVVASGGSAAENERVFRATYWPGDDAVAHLEFALKYEGVNLQVLAAAFAAVPEAQLVGYIRSAPTGKYARRLWFFCEFLMERTLPIPDLKTGNYIDALPADDYITIAKGERSPRQRVVNNLLGPRAFCPVVRKSSLLAGSLDLEARCESLLSSYSRELLQRAFSYIFQKETKSSFAIERLKPTASRAEKFIALLRLADSKDFVTKEQLIRLQNLIVDDRFQDSDYRHQQNYVGQNLVSGEYLIHYISPKPSDLPDLMAGLIAAHLRMSKGQVDPIVHAAVVAYGFVYLHPFEDGNGRIHRFLIHNVLALRGAVPRGFLLPVSAVMVKQKGAYDASLETLSKPLMAKIDYDVDEEGALTVIGESRRFYQLLDLTTQAEALLGFLHTTADQELAEELEYLAQYDAAKAAIQNIVDMPNRKLELLLKALWQNGGKLSAKKRDSHFGFLTADEIAAMEAAFEALRPAGRG